MKEYLYEDAFVCEQVAIVSLERNMEAVRRHIQERGDGWAVELWWHLNRSSDWGRMTNVIKGTLRCRGFLCLVYHMVGLTYSLLSAWRDV